MDRLRSQRRTEQGPALVQRLFRGTNALELSKQVRQQRQGDILPAAACGANASETDAALTYGEVVPSSFVAIMNSIRAPLTKVRGCSNSSGSGGLVFYDLGCGQGKACFAALLEPNCYFRKIVGIEIMGELVAIALKVKAKLLLAMEMAEGMSGGETETTTSYAVTACLASPRVAGILPLRYDMDLNFKVGDIFEVNDEHPIDSDWCEAADVFYCANLLFSEGMIHALSRKVVGMKAGAVFISLRQLDEDITAGRAVLLEESFYKMSWHYASVFVYLIL